MTANEVISLAQNGELKTLAVKDDVNAVIGFINLGLIELYKRFQLETKEFLITMVDGIEEYTLPSDFMWIVSAYGEVDYNDIKGLLELPVNDEDDPLSVNTVGWNKIQIPSAIGGERVSLIYVAAPTLITELTLNDPLPIPPQFLEALLNYIGYRGHGSVDGKINAESNTHYQRFEMSINKIKKEGMFTPESVKMTRRVDIKGFV